LKGESSRERVMMGILRLAADSKGEQRCGYLVKGLKGKAAKNTILHYLGETIEERLMKKSAASAGEGFGPRYSITKKGLNLLLKKGATSILDGLNSILALEKADPRRLDEWRKAARQEYLNIKITEDMPLKERYKAIGNVDKMYRGRLGRAYLAVHKLVCELSLPEGLRDKQMYIGVVEDGTIHMIPAEMLKKDGYLPGESNPGPPNVGLSHAKRHRRKPN